MLFRRFAIAGFAIIMVITAIGCANMGGGQISGVNWALAKNGGRVSAFSEEPNYPASAVIDGITKPDWDKEGAGWQAQITVGGMARSSRAQRDEQEKNWIVVELSQPITVNEVRIYTADSEKYPASKFGISDLLVQYEMKTATNDLIWANTKRPGKGIGDQDNAIRNNLNGVINARFEPVTTQKIRVLIYSTHDLKSTPDGKSREGVIRIAEIEVYGSGKQKQRSEVDNLFNSN
jgi:hypothetical protein